MLIFEVRIPTYNRPDLLRRAIESLQAQTYPHWTATVYDDASSGEEVVRSISDGRIRYQRNSPRLGACANIDQCFSSAPTLSGHYGYVLEDDNFLLPGFLSLMVRHLSEKPWQLIQANQRIWSKERGLHPESETTRGLWFRPGEMSPLHLQASLLFMEGLSNGGMIWKLAGACNFQVGPSVQHFGIQEACRTLLVKAPFLFVEEPLAVFNFMPRSETARGGENDRSLGRGLQSIRRFILESSPEVIESLPQKQNLQDQVVSLLAHSGYPHLVRGRKRLSQPILKAYLKGIALRLTQPDPCRSFLAGLKASSSGTAYVPAKPIES